MTGRLVRCGSRTATLLLAACVLLPFWTTRADAAGLSTPIAIDDPGLISVERKLGVSDATCVAVDGDIAVVGSPTVDAPGKADCGAAYVFERRGPEWVQVAQLFASDASVGNRFGRSVDVDGDTIVVGSTFSSHTPSGAAYVFVRSESGWSEQAVLTGTYSSSTDEFGYSVAVSGDTVVVGAPNDEVSGTSGEGLTYAFERAGGVWGVPSVLSGGSGTGFGAAVAISGDRIIVGAPWGTVSSTSVGTAYVFARDVSGWLRSPVLYASDRQVDDNFGISVGIDGDYAVIGNSANDDFGVSSGSAYIFKYSGSAWTQQVKLLPATSVTKDYFGSVVVISGERIWIGANGADSLQGAVFGWILVEGSWQPAGKRTPPASAVASRLGSSMGLSGDTLIVAAFGVGTAHVYAPYSPAYQVSEDEALTVTAEFGVLANDADADGDSITATLTAAPANGELVLADDGSFTYKPDADFNGTDTFTYSAYDGVLSSLPATVTITVTPVADAPVSDADAYETAEDEALAIDAPGIIASDTDADGDLLTAALIAGPEHGGLVLSHSGGFTYTPDADWFGTDTFTYRAFDGDLYSEAATVSITVAAVADVPVSDADSLEATEDETLSVAAPGVLADDSDADGDGLAAALVTGPSHGELALEADGSLTYTPDADYNGIDTFTYEATDGALASDPATVTITVAPVADAPAGDADSYETPEEAALSNDAPGVLANDSDADGDDLTAVLSAGPAHGELSLAADGSFTYTPDADWFGTDTFIYRAFDGDLYSDPVTVTITVTPVRDSGIVTRVSGSDRFGTAAAIARKGWDPAGNKSWPGVEHVIIANGENGREADPLSAAGLAGVYDAPVLTVSSRSIPSSIKSVITEIAARRKAEGKTLKVHLVGGTSVVPDARWTQIKAIPGVSQTKDRVSGPNRYATSAKVAEQIVTVAGAKNVPGVILIAGDNSAAFYDALSVSPIAFANTMPMLSVQKASVPAEIRALLNGSLAGKPRFAASSSTYIAGSLSGATRLATSSNRTVAARQIATAAVTRGWLDVTDTALASTIPDSLTGGAFLGRRGGVVLFTTATPAINAEPLAFITAKKAEIANGWILGGTAVVPSSQETSFRNLVK